MTKLLVPKITVGLKKKNGEMMLWIMSGTFKQDIINKLIKNTEIFIDLCI